VDGDLARLRTTRDLPDDMRLDPGMVELRGLIDRTGLSVGCRHGHGCIRCLLDAARELLAAAPTPPA
jgi:hypothetical protein